MATSTTGKPTSRQLAYLKALADRTGQTFVYPATRRQASAEIDRLKNTRPSSRSERRIERKLIADQIQAGPADSARVREDEISGRGSSATWMHNREREPAPVADSGTTASSRPRGPIVGKRIELARYITPAGERVIHGQRVDGVIRVTDRPVGPTGTDARAYLVERGLETKGELDALVADYLATALRRHTVPMADAPLQRYLDHVA